MNWNKFRLNLPDQYPLKPPTAVWLTDVAHPNIVPNVSGAVCVSLLGEDWRPNLSLVSILNAFYYLLADPNPNNVFDHPTCRKAAEVCKKYGFPKMARLHGGEADDLVTYRIVPATRVIRPIDQAAARDVMRFKVSRRRSRVKR